MLRHTGPSESCNVTMVAWLCGWPVRRRSQEGARDLKARAFLPPPCRPRLVPLSLLKSKIHVHASLLHIRCGLPCSLGLERRWDGRVWSPYMLDMRKVRPHPSSVDPCQLTFLHKAACTSEMADVPQTSSDGSLDWQGGVHFGVDVRGHQMECTPLVYHM